MYQQDDGDVVIDHRGDGEYRQFFISQHNGTAARTLFGGSTSGTAYAYHAGAIKFNTTSAGITVTGEVTDDKGELRSIPFLSLIHISEPTRPY